MCCQTSWWIAAKSQISYQQGEDRDDMTGRSTLDVLSEQIPTRLNEPIRYHAKFKPLWLPETKHNPITSDHICHLLSTTSIQCAVMPRNDAFVLSAVQVSAVHDTFPGAFCTRSSSKSQHYCIDTYLNVFLQLRHPVWIFVMKIWRYFMHAWNILFAHLRPHWC